MIPKSKFLFASRLTQVSALATTAFFFSHSANAADVVKANNTTLLNNGASWALGAVPTSSDVAVWDSTVLAANSTALGGATSWSGIRIANPGGAVTISLADLTATATAGYNLTLGSSGIDMSAATQNLTLQTGGAASGSLVTIGANQSWNVGTGRTLANNVALNGSANLAKDGVGTLTLGAANNTYTGVVTVNAGVLNISNSSAAGTGGITLANGGTLNIGNSTTFISTAVTLSGTGAIGNITSSNATGAFSSTVTGTSDQFLNIGGATAVNFSANTKQLQTFNGTVTIASGSTLAFRSTSLNNGGDNTTFDVNGSISTRNGGTVSLGALTGSGSLGMGGSGGNGINLTYVIGAKNIDATYSGTFTDADTVNSKRVAVTKVGTGNQTLSGASIYTGGTTVIAGTLSIGNDSALGTGALNLGGTAAATPTIVASGGARTIANNVVLLATTTGTATVAGSNALTVTGSVTNSGGNRTLTVNNSALTTISGGVSLSEGATNRTLTLNGSGITTISGVIGNGGTATASSLTYSGTGTLNLGNSNTYAGTTTVSSGTVVAGNASALGTSAVSLGGGSLQTTVANVNSGAVTVSGGTLSANGSSAGSYTLSSTSNFSMTAGTLSLGLNGTTAGTYDQIIGSGGATFSLTGGILDLSSAAVADYNATYQLFSGFAPGTVSGLTISGYNTTGYSASLDTSGVLSFVAVPEPSASALLGLGLGTLVLRRKRRAA